MSFITNPIPLIADARVVDGRLKFGETTRVELRFGTTDLEQPPQLQLVNGFRSNAVDKIAIGSDADEDGGALWTLQCGQGTGRLRSAVLSFNGKALGRRVRATEAVPDDQLNKRQLRDRALYNAFVECDAVQLYVRFSQTGIMHALVLQLGYRADS